MVKLSRLPHLVLFLALAAAPAWAITPADILVIGGRYDDLVSLDPAEIYEASGAEYAANVYDRLVTIVNDRPEGALAERWEVSPDGRRFTFFIRPGATFQSGTSVSAKDAAWSLVRAVKLDKGAAFLLRQLGLTANDAERRIQAPDERRLILDLPEALAEDFVLKALASWVGSVIDSALVRKFEQKGDFGNEWLKIRSAGSGAYKLSFWRPGEGLALDAFPRHWRGMAPMKRVVFKHLAEPSVLRLMVAKGDLDVARGLSADDLAALGRLTGVRVRTAPQAGLIYLAMNQRHPALSKAPVRQAIRRLIDYEGIAGRLLKDTKIPHQSILGEGFPGARPERPYRLDIEAARKLLAEAGIKPGELALALDVRNVAPSLDIAQALQADFARAGIRLDLRPGDGKQVLTRYRARVHQLVLAQWSPDFLDPHSNAQGFAWNPDNSDQSPFRLLAWRNAWEAPDLTRLVQRALRERDPNRRGDLYDELQRRLLEDSPYAVMFQDRHVWAERVDVEGFALGPGVDQLRLDQVSKRRANP
ncbi:MAG: ABC transporter substrate-binding protein [Rhodospirillales bacterium]|nr:ABC transporter substrate-binding protein [Rhodospirillales bacterium]